MNKIGSEYGPLKLSVACSCSTYFLSGDSTAFRILVSPGCHSSFYFFYMNSRLAPEKKNC